MILTQSTAPYAEPISLNEAKAQTKMTATADDPLLTGQLAAARQIAENVTGRQIVVATFKLYLDCFPADQIELPKPPLIEVDSISYSDSDNATQTVATTVYQVDTDSLVGRVYLKPDQTWPSAYAKPKAVVITYKAGILTPYAAANATDLTTWSGRNPTDADIVRLTVSGGASAAVPTGLARNTDYHLLDSSTNTCKFAATSGGTAIDITGDGTGQQFIMRPQDVQLYDTIRAAMLLLIAHWYENREAVVVGTITSELPMAVDALLSASAVPKI